MQKLDINELREIAQAAQIKKTEEKKKYQEKVKIRTEELAEELAQSWHERLCNAIQEAAQSGEFKCRCKFYYTRFNREIADGSATMELVSAKIIDALPREMEVRCEATSRMGLDDMGESEITYYMTFSVNFDWLG